LQTVTITGNSKILYTCSTNKTALFTQPVVTVSHWMRPNPKRGRASSWARLDWRCRPLLVYPELW